jgi:ribose/xylose/arabinose/galactoside ABC-type transport system permease subunit
MKTGRTEAQSTAHSMEDAYLLPAIAAVVLGDTHILGGRGCISEQSQE